MTHSLKRISQLASLTLSIALGAASPWDDTPAQPSQNAQPVSLSLSPAVVMVRCKPGQSTTQVLRMRNMTPMTFRFDIEVQDVVVRDGARVFVPAGRTPSGIAASAVATPRSVVAEPQQEAAVSVTVTVPEPSPERAIVVFFRGKTAAPAQGGSVNLGASLGTLMTFTLSEDYHLDALKFAATPQTETSNLTISHELVNSGQEVVIPKGAAAILDGTGKRVSKATFEPQRLLPGERLVFTATNPSQLQPGRYRVISSFEYEGRVMTTAGEFSVP